MDCPQQGTLSYDDVKRLMQREPTERLKAAIDRCPCRTRASECKWCGVAMVVLHERDRAGK